MEYRKMELKAGIRAEAVEAGRYRIYMKRGIELSATYTDKLEEQYAKARVRNQAPSNVYYCATTKKELTPRSLDLQSDYVFCVVDDEKEKPSEKNNSIKEYRLQASLVKKAKANKWLLPFEGKKWTLLDAERNFAGEDLSIKKKGKRLDLLAYEAETKTYIVLELKVTRAFKKAKQELLSYTSTISDNLEMANRCYSVDANNVKGYIVWNALSWPPRKTIQTKDNPWGLIEYDEAFLAKDKIESITFKLFKDPD